MLFQARIENQIKNGTNNFGIRTEHIIEKNKTSDYHKIWDWLCLEISLCFRRADLPKTIVIAGKLVEARWVDVLSWWKKKDSG